MTTAGRRKSGFCDNGGIPLYSLLLILLKGEGIVGQGFKVHLRFGFFLFF